MKSISLITFLFLSHAVLGQDEALGKWITVDDKTGVKKSVVEVYEEDGKYYGKVIKMIYRDSTMRCTKCLGDLKDRPVVGMNIISGMKYHKRNRDFSKGTLLNPESGKIYKAEMWVENDKLMVRGYLMIFYRTQTWIPYKEGE
ncbi:MAG: DUF2147 domain-containing protein [Ekhidna sp.]|nr:DUF2147 domain-containing protein [Ekhidna sp.]